MIKQKLLPAVMGYACIYILCIFMTACNPPGPLEQTLRQAGNNRIELEEVLKHYQKDKLRYKAA